MINVTSRSGISSDECFLSSYRIVYLYKTVDKSQLRQNSMVRKFLERLVIILQLTKANVFQLCTMVCRLVAYVSRNLNLPILSSMVYLGFFCREWRETLKGYFTHITVISNPSQIDTFMCDERIPKLFFHQQIAYYFYWPF